MPSTFDFHLKTDAAALTAELRFYDSAGNQLDWRQIRLADYPASRWEGLFDLRRYVRRYAGNLHPLGAAAPLGEAELLRELGVFLGREVLGEEVLRYLGRGIQQRSVRVHLPPGSDDLASAFARVPWEIARAGTEDRTLAEKNVLFRALASDGEPRPEPLQLQPGEPLRVLLVFAEAPGSRPLAARLERRQLLELFHRQVYPHRRVEVDALCHGVTRERLKDQIQDRGGYHILHWIGHGRLNRLELYAEGKEPRDLTGQGLVDLFEEAGGYVPRLVFLCLPFRELSQH